MRRRPKPDVVRHHLNRAGEVVADTYGEDIVRLRRAMHRAVTELYAGEPDNARRTLSAALAERWWK